MKLSFWPGRRIAAQSFVMHLIIHNSIFIAYPWRTTGRGKWPMPVGRTLLTSKDQQHNSTQTEVVKRYRRIEEFVPSNWSEGTVAANGIRHHYYQTGGDRPPLVLLHGFLEGALPWLRTARALERDYDVVMVDARGPWRAGM